MTSISRSTPPTYASALISSTPSLSLAHKRQHNKKSTGSSSSWADQVDDVLNNKNQNAPHKKQKLNQIMNWKKSKSNSRPHLHPRKNNTNIKNAYFSQHKDGEKQNDQVLSTQKVEGEERKEGLLAQLEQKIKEEEGRGETDISDTHSTCTDSSSLSCDSFSTVSTDAMSCDTASGAGDEEGKKKKKKKNKKRKRKYSAAEEGKKVFVGGIAFEDCDPFLSNNNDTLSILRQQKFSQIFYLFGSVNRIQGHWESGYCFVVFSKRRDAKLAIKCLSMAKVRRKVVQNLRDNIAPSGVLPLPSFYVRWANTPPSSASSSSSSSSSTPSTSASSSLSSSPSLPSLIPIPISSEVAKAKESGGMEDGKEEKEGMEDGEEEEGKMEWVHTLKEEDMVDEDVERLMRELLKLHSESV